MPVVSSHRDDQALTFTFVAEFPAGVDRVWQVWADPRQLERWWGPPTWPATFAQYDFEVGGGVQYHMTGPDGQKSHGWWTITAVDAPRRLEFDDGFADQHGKPVASMPSTHAIVTLEEIPTGTRMTTVTTFASVEQLEQLVGMGMVDGMTAAMNQIDALLADETP